MDFSEPERKRPAENLLPMINVVFLLLIFFLIVARMAGPEPFDVSLPKSEHAAEAQGEFTLHISADGETGYRDMKGEEALTALAKAIEALCKKADCSETVPRLSIRADASSPARAVAALLPKLAPLGFGRVEIVTSPGAQ
jgi:biopolymer transport protein ExbD